jgi:hypothetical protein
MTPTWAVILVGVTSGALASLVTAIVTASHERAAEFRERMLNAADELSTAAIVALQQIRDTASEIKQFNGPLVASGSFKPEIKTLLDQANKAVDDVFAKQAGVHLLFADESAATVASVGVTAHLRNMLMALDQHPDSINNHMQMSLYSRNFSGTQEEHVKFNQAALALQETWWDRLLERWRLRRRSKKES